jgi:hypothetical protein
LEFKSGGIGRKSPNAQRALRYHRALDCYIEVGREETR